MTAGWSWSPAPSALPSDIDAVAHSVFAATPHPQDEFEVAVVLATFGYNDARARELGAQDLLDLAQQVRTLQPPRVSAAAGATSAALDGPTRLTAGLLLRSLLYTSPWIVAIAALVLGRVSFWSTITPQVFSSTVALALFTALVVTGGFLQAFARRGTFYLLQGVRPLVGWSARWTLGSGAVAAVVAALLGWVLLQLAHAYTANSVTYYLAFTVAISFALLSLAPLYLRRAGGAILVAAAVGGAVAVVGGRLIDHGDYLNPYLAQDVALLSLVALTTTALVLDGLVLSRPMPHEAEALVPAGEARPPHRLAALATVAPYMAYGFGFFALIVTDHLVAGGIWSGGYTYPGDYELAVGVALVLLIPALTYANAAAELLSAATQTALDDHTVADPDDLAARMQAFVVRHLLVTLAVAVATGLVVLGAVAVLAPHLSLLHGFPQMLAVSVVAALAYALLSVGILGTALLFALGVAGPSAAAAWLGVLVSAGVGGVLHLVVGADLAAALGLLTGVAVFAAIVVAATLGTFRTFDISYYRAF